MKNNSLDLDGVISFPCMKEVRRRAGSDAEGGLSEVTLDTCIAFMISQ